MKSFTCRFSGFVRRYFFLWLLFFLPSPVFCGERVLLLSSYHPGFPTFLRQVKGARKVFDPYNIHLDVEFMDSKRFYSPEDISRYRAYLFHKLKQLPGYKVVLAADDNALRFLLKNRKGLLAGVPLVFFGINDRRLALSLNRTADVTGVVEAVSMRETLLLMKKLHPASRTVHVVVDGSVSGQADLKYCRKVAGDIAGLRLRVHNFSGFSTDGFAADLKDIPEEEPLLLLSAYRNKYGCRIEFFDGLKFLRNNYRGAVYHLWYHGMGKGVLGGRMIDHFQQAVVASGIALRILNGESIAGIPVVQKSPNKYIFDIRELDRLRIDRSALPADSVVLFRKETVWEKYRGRIILIAGLFFLMAGLVGALSINYFRRKRVERMLRAREALYRTYLEVAPYGILILDVRGYIIRINGMVEQIFGLRRDLFIGRHLRKLPVRGREFREFRHRLIREGIASGEFHFEERPQQFRYIFSRAVRLEQGGYLVYLTDISSRVEAGNALLKALHDKELLIKEVHHRVKNNMQIIASLLEIQESTIDDDHSLCFRKSRARIKTISMVHEQLINTKDTERIELAPLFQDIVYGLLGSVPGASHKVGVLLDVEPVSVDIDTAIPLALIINELVDNVLHHAFPEGARGSLRISLGLAGETVFLEVQDTGHGISEAVMGDGIGLQMVRILCNQLRATLEFPPAKGLLARIEFTRSAVGLEKWKIYQTIDDSGLTVGREGEVDLFIGE